MGGPYNFKRFKTVSSTARCPAPLFFSPKGCVLTSPFCISAHIFAREPLAFGHLRAVAEAGFHRLELWAMTPHFDVAEGPALSRLKEWLDALSLEAVSFHAPFYRDLERARAGEWLSFAHPDPAHRREAVARTETAMRALGGLGARVAVLHPGGPPPSGSEDTRENFRESVEALLPLAEKADMVLAIENIPSPLGRPEAVAQFVEGCAHPRVRACLDTGHALLTEGARTAAAFRRLAPLAAAIHLHDNDGEHDGHLIPGEGVLPWNALWESLEEAGFSGPRSFEIRRKEEKTYSETLSCLAHAPGAYAEEGKI